MLETTKTIEKLQDVINRQSVVTNTLKDLYDTHGADVEVAVHTAHTPFGSYLMHIEIAQ